MTLPSLTKTHQFNVGQAITAQGTALATNRRILRTIKNSMIGFGTQPWTVRYSCSSTVAGSAGDGVDRWSADSDLVWANAGSAHSWIVLRQTGIATNYEYLISCESSSSSGSILTLVVSPSAGFTGGSTTARPTATDEQVRLNGAAWGGVGTVDANAVVQAMQSTDGQVTRVIVHVSNTARTFWSLGKPANALSGWSNPSATLILGSASAQVITYANLANTASSGGRVGSTNVTFFLTGEGCNGSLLGEIMTFAGENSGSYIMGPVGLYSATTSNRDRYGTLQDLWWGPSGIAEGTTAPSSGTTGQFVAFGCLWLPWNQTVPVIA